jgi:putative nucleotidyltransferase with HDIG domain
MVRDIADGAELKKFKKGDFICREGDIPNALFILLSGYANIVKESPDGNHTINQVGPGETLGEMGIMDEMPRSASIVVTSEKAEFVVFCKKLIMDSLERDPVIFRETLKVISSRLRRGNIELEKRLIEIEKKNQELEESYTATVFALSQALEFRDKVTGGHSERVTAYSLIMANSMGYPEEEMENLRLGALLHDVGKIGVSDLILNKQGKLTDEEFAIMQEHPTLGMKIIANIDFLKGARSVVYSHHEKWNGRGYPQGLVGDDIPLAARIFAIADVFDALTMERPYKSAWTPEEARDEIVRCAGDHFDANVVENFVKEFDKMVGIMEKSKRGETISIQKGLLI